MDVLLRPWPWYVAGPLIGLVVPALLLVGGQLFGVSSNFRHLCAIVAPGRNAFFRYDWKRTGLWNLVFAVGILIGGFLVARFMTPADYTIAISAATKADLARLGITDFGGFAPRQVFEWSNLLTARGLFIIAGGGFLVGFGSRWAGGCTSGHGITGLASFQLPSLVAVIGFFAGGMAVSFLLLPMILQAWP